VNIWFVLSARRDFMGGGEIFAVRLASWLKKRGHTVRIVTRPDSRLAEAARAVWLDVRTLAMRNDIDWFSRRTLARWFAADRPDVVFGAFGRDIKLLGPGARSAGARIFWLQGVPLSDRSRVHQKLDQLYVDRYIVPSAYLADEIVRRTGFDPAKITVVHPALDPGPFAHDQAVADRGDRFRLAQKIPLDAPVSICPARLVEAKGQHVLLDAWVEVTQARPDAHLLLAGDGPARAALEAQARRLDLASRVHFLGHLTDIRPALWIADLMVLPTFADSFPVVVLESMAAGVAVVASRVGGIPEQIVDGECGLLVPPRDAPSLARAVIRVLDDASLRHALVRGGRERLSRFVADRVFAEFETLLGGPVAAAGVPSCT
jgi:glycosyltransferase involved in cell wall biosynthesis